MDGAKVEEKRSEEAARAREAAGWGTAERGALVRGMSALEVASTGTAEEGWEGEWETGAAEKAVGMTGDLARGTAPEKGAWGRRRGGRGHSR